jgi:hypothetical protein
MTLYKIQVNKAQIKIISKALDVLKSISKGEISRASSVISENKITQVKHTGELEEIFDQRIRQLKLSLIDIENIYFSKYLTILKLGEFGLKLLHIKKKLIDSGFILNKNNREYLDINLSDNDLDIISLACDLYWNLQCGNLEFIVEVLYNINDSYGNMLIELKNITELATGFATSAKHEIESNAINRKSKWCYDISKKISFVRNMEPYKTVGTLPQLKIKKL